LKTAGEGTGAGVNTSGFSALLAGARVGIGGSFDYLGSDAAFWSSTGPDGPYATYLSLKNNNGGINIGDFYFEGSGFSVRCLED
jgi:uncharacterized protein (TIGR02145 family)